MPALTRKLSVSLGYHRLDYTLHRVPRRRHVHLLVDDDGELHVRGPYFFSAREAEALIRDHEAWVLRRLEATRARVAARPSLVSGAWLPLLDDKLKLLVCPVEQLDLFESVPARAQDVRRVGDELRVRVAGSREAEVREKLTVWYRLQARELLTSELIRLAERLDVSPGRITIRAQKTCWGSCSQRGNINLNWRLVLLPGELARYVLVHELCHLRHMNHGPAFWRLVATLVPNYRQRRALLRTLQGTLAL